VAPRLEATDLRVAVGVEDEIDTRHDEREEEEDREPHGLGQEIADAARAGDHGHADP
jgi:hypothetical protein